MVFDFAWLQECVNFQVTKNQSEFPGRSEFFSSFTHINKGKSTNYKCRLTMDVDKNYQIGIIFYHIFSDLSAACIEPEKKSYIITANNLKLGNILINRCFQPIKVWFSNQEETFFIESKQKQLRLLFGNPLNYEVRVNRQFKVYFDFRLSRKNNQQLAPYISDELFHMPGKIQQSICLSVILRASL
jgi:hypothetical protein